jgi:hypothetical protein
MLLFGKATLLGAGMSFLKFVFTTLWRANKRRLFELLIALITIGLIPGTVSQLLLHSFWASIGTVFLWVTGVFVWMFWMTYKDPEHHQF